MALKVDTYDSKGEKTVGSIPWLALNKESKLGLVAQIMRVFQANQRRGLAKAKTRGEVDGTTKKLYKQKGTGGARHGSRKAPLFVGGGKAHGPSGTQNYSGQLNKKVIAKGLLSLLIDKQKSGRLVVVDCPKFTKSSQANAYFSPILKANKYSSALLLVDHKAETNTVKFCKNLATISVIGAQTASVFAINQAKIVLLSTPSLPLLQVRGDLK